MRTDTQIRDDVIAELDFDPSIEAGAVGVAVDNGVVTLSGHVPSYAQKIAAANAAKRVVGVRAIAQDIEVRLTEADKRSDTEIAERAANVVAWNVIASKDDLKVRVERGWVTLQGEVNWQYQRIDAENAVRRLAGVVGVSNLITVKSRVAQQDISRSITAALHRNAQLEANNVSVEVDGGSVTLSGKVRSLYERQIVESAAWAVPGVRSVMDTITVQ